MAQIIIFEHRNLHGNHKHIFTSEPNLNAGDDNFFNDKLSSFVIVEGRWQFFRDSNFGNPASQVLQPGVYRWVEDFGIPNDSVSSLRLL